MMKKSAPLLFFASCATLLLCSCDLVDKYTGYSKKGVADAPYTRPIANRSVPSAAPQHGQAVPVQPGIDTPQPPAPSVRPAPIVEQKVQKPEVKPQVATRTPVKSSPTGLSTGSAVKPTPPKPSGAIAVGGAVNKPPTQPAAKPAASSSGASVIRNTGPIVAARAVPGNPQFVYNPINPKAVINIMNAKTGKPWHSGKKLRVPKTEFYFLVP